MAKIIIELKCNQLPDFTNLGVGLPVHAEILVIGSKDEYDALPVLIANKLAACYAETLKDGVSSALKASIEEIANE